MVQKMEMEGKKQPIKKDLLIIMPAYNEEKNIRQVLEQLNSQEITNIADVLVMNDGSSDSTNWIVKEYHHTLVTHVFNLGYGSAIQLGYKYAIRRKYKYVIQMDSDGQHDVCNIPIIYQKLKQRDILVRWFDEPRIRDFVRISIGTQEDMQQLLAAVAEILQEVR